MESAKPRHGRGNAVGVVRGQTVIRVQQLHAARRAVGKAAVGRVPCRLICRAAEELGAQIAAEKIVVHDVFIIAEIAELVVLCLKQENIIEVDVPGVIGTLPEQLAALQHDGLRLDIRAAEVCRDGPGGPCTHRVTADGKTGRIDIIHRSEQCIRIIAAGRAVGQCIAVRIGRVMLIEEAQI